MSKKLPELNDEVYVNNPKFVGRVVPWDGDRKREVCQYVKKKQSLMVRVQWRNGKVGTYRTKDVNKVVGVEHCYDDYQKPSEMERTDRLEQDSVRPDSSPFRSCNFQPLTHANDSVKPTKDKILSIDREPVDTHVRTTKLPHPLRQSQNERSGQTDDEKEDDDSWRYNGISSRKENLDRDNFGQAHCRNIRSEEDSKAAMQAITQKGQLEKVPYNFEPPREPTIRGGSLPFTSPFQEQEEKEMKAKAEADRTRREAQRKVRQEEQSKRSQEKALREERAKIQKEKKAEEAQKAKLKPKPKPQAMRRPLPRRPLPTPKPKTLKEGYFQKQGEGAFGMCRWQKRRFVLTAEWLRYYTGDDADSLVKEIDLRNGNVVRVHRSSDDGLYWNMVTGTPLRTWYFYCDSPTETQEWIDATTEALRLQAEAKKEAAAAATNAQRSRPMPTPPRPSPNKVIRSGSIVRNAQPESRKRPSPGRRPSPGTRPTSRHRSISGKA